MKQLNALFIGLLMPIVAMAANDDWIGLDEAPVTHVGLSLSKDQQDNTSIDLYAQHQLSPDTRIDLDFSRDRLARNNHSFDSNDLNARLAFELNPLWLITLGYHFQGQRQQLQIEQFGLRTEYTPYPAFFALELGSGDLKLYTRHNLPVRFHPGRGIRSNLHSVQLNVGWWFENFSLSAQFRHIGYQRDVSRLETRPLLQLLVEPGALAQSGLLLSRQVSIDLLLPLQQNQFGAHLQSSTSALNRQSVHSLQLDWTQQLDSHMDALFFISRYQGPESNWTFSAGLEWKG